MTAKPGEVCGKSGEAALPGGQWSVSSESQDLTNKNNDFTWFYRILHGILHGILPHIFHDFWVVKGCFKKSHSLNLCEDLGVLFFTMPKAVWHCHPVSLPLSLLDELQSRSFLEVFDYIKGSMSFPHFSPSLGTFPKQSTNDSWLMAGHLARLESIEELSDESRSAKSDGPGPVQLGTQWAQVFHLMSMAISGS